MTVKNMESVQRELVLVFESVCVPGHEQGSCEADRLRAVPSFRPTAMTTPLISQAGTKQGSQTGLGSIHTYAPTNWTQIPTHACHPTTIQELERCCINIKGGKKTVKDTKREQKCLFISIHFLTYSARNMFTNTL